MSQVIDKELHMYIEKLNPEQKQSLLTMIKSFFTGTGTRTTTDQYNLEIDAAMVRMHNEDYLTQNDVEKDAEQW